MHVLVTGGAGFIGSHIADKLLSEGHRVLVIDDLSSGFKEQVPSKARFKKMSLESPQLAAFLKKQRIDAVCHVAAKTNLRDSLTNPAADAHVNILGLLNLLEACKTLRLKKFVFSSTGGALYGAATTFPVKESAPTNPTSPYGVSKLAGERYLYYYHVVHDLPVVILRYSNVFGPRQERKNPAGALVSFIRKVLAQEQIVINGDGKQTRDFVYVEDVALANVSALAHKGDGYLACNISGAHETSIQDLIKYIEKYTGMHAKVVHGKAIRGEILRSRLSHKKAHDILQWRPRVSVAEGIQRVVEYLTKES